jgi:general secretion pathway protein L
MSGVLQLPAGVALRLLAARFLGWWTGELRTLVPPGLARRLTAPVGGERRLRIPADGALPAAHGLPRGTAVTLELDPALVFEAVLDLPSAAAGSLAEILRHQIGLLVPLEPAELAWSHAVTRRDPQAGTIRVAVAIVRRQVLEEAQAAARAAGLMPRRIEGLGHAFSDATTAPSPGRRRWQRGIGAAALACLVLALGLRLFTEPKAADLTLLRHESAEAAALRQRVDRLAEPVALLRARIAAAAPLPVLDDLTRLLPDEVWLDSLRLRGEVLEIGGTAPSAAALIPLFEAAPRFAAPAFRAALTVTPEGRERFALAVRVRPAPGPAP